jgi:putative inorganic carbon (HCO3(-)) transporter
MKKTSSILMRLLEVGILAVIAIAPTQYAFEVTDKVYLSVVDPLIWGVLVLFGVCVAMRLIRPSWPSLFGSLLILMIGLSAINASNRMSSMKELFQMVEYFTVAYILFAYLVSAPSRRAAALYLFEGIGTVIVAVSLVQYLKPSLSVLDVAGTFGNRNVLGGYMALLLPLMAGRMLCEKNRFRLAWYALTIAIGLLVTLSGGAAIAIIIGLMFVTMLSGRLAFIGLMAALLLGMFLIVPHLPRDNALLLRESIQLFDDDANVSRRYTEWEAAANMIEAHPLSGVGAGNYQENIGMHYGILPDPIGPTEPDTQNLYMVTTASAGLIALIALLGLFCQAAVSALRKYASAGSGMIQGLHAGLLGSIIAFAIAAIWSPLLVRGISIPLVFILVLARHSPPTSPDK